MNDSTPELLSENATVFLKSLHRCLENQYFLPNFYARFFGSGEQVREKFIDSDLEQQHIMLERSLRLSAVAVSGGKAGLDELHKRAISHNQQNYCIEPHLYQFWLEAIIETAAEFDQYWDDSLEEKWRLVLGQVIEIMSAGFEAESDMKNTGT